MTKQFALAVCLGSMVAGCSGTYPQSKTTPVASGAGTPDKGAHGAEMDISKADMPFKIVRARGGEEVSVDAFYNELATADGICIGERHSNPHHHWVQYEVVGQLGERRSGQPTALGMEMVQRPFQGVLDDYAANKISEQELRTRTGWKARWGHDYRMYGPIINLAVGHGMSLLALNVANELRRKLSNEGMDALTDAERARLPELNLDDAAHKAWFDEVMKAMMTSHGHSHGHSHGKAKTHGATPAPTKKAPSMDSIYRTQVLWDETMAETASRWLAGADGRQVIILAGNGHCHDSAIVRRMHRRGIERVVSVRPIVDDGADNIASELASPMVDYLFVMTAPKYSAPQVRDQFRKYRTSRARSEERSLVGPSDR